MRLHIYVYSLEKLQVLNRQASTFRRLFFNSGKSNFVDFQKIENPQKSEKTELYATDAIIFTKLHGNECTIFSLLKRNKE